MADIKQAAKWMQEGKVVRRAEIPYWEIYQGDRTGHVMNGANDDAQFRPDDLLADDWEIVR
jgi:hypothetical protein